MGDWINSIHTGDAREQLRELPESSVHCVMTSPPYWQLRDYGDGTVSVWGGDRDCEHDWQPAGTVRRGGQNSDENPPDVGGKSHAQDTGIRGGGVESHECRRCGAWRGQLGLEPTRGQFIDNLVTVFREIRRVIRPDGSAWLNLGDTFKDKQKQLIPHRVAIVLQSDGWVVRNDVTWVKPAPMPSSVKDRLNTTTEQIFHLTPEPDYWYDLDAIREPHTSRDKYRDPGEKRDRADENDAKGTTNHELGINDQHPAGKNPGDVFEVTTKPFPDAHFAVYPPELCDKPIKASCPPTVCADCGSPYERETRDESGFTDGVCIACGALKSKHKQGTKNTDDSLSRNDTDREIRNCSNKVTTGWSQRCDCDTDATESGICLDPFAGAGTTCLKAKELGRRFVGIELNPEYADMARVRVGLTPEDPSRVRSDDAQQGLEAFVDGGGSDD